jgi:penicillin amidase/acyl-homoserine-lactone acylase
MILRSVLFVVGFALVAFFSFFGAHETRLTWFDAKAAIAAAGKYDSTIVRDRYGVPHISGRRDADVAFGLAYAHAEIFSRSRPCSLPGAAWPASRAFPPRKATSMVLFGHLECHRLALRDGPLRRHRASNGFAAGFNLYAAQHRYRPSGARR